MEQNRLVEFPGCPMVRTQHLHCPDLGLISGWGTKIPEVMKHGQTKNKIGNHSKIYVYFQKLITINVILIFLIFLYMAVCVFKEEKAMAPHSSTLAWEIPWAEEPGRLQSMGSLRVGHNWATSLSLFTFMHWRRKWQPTPVFLPGESQGRGNLVGCRLWGHTESDTTEAT